MFDCLFVLVPKCIKLEDLGLGSRKTCFLYEHLIMHLSTREASYNISTLVCHSISAQQEWWRWRQIADMKPVSDINSGACRGVCVFVREKQMDGDKVVTYVCVCMSVCRCRRMYACVADARVRVNEQNVSPSACVYTFPTVDLKAQYQWNVHRGLFVQS